MPEYRNNPCKVVFYVAAEQCPTRHSAQITDCAVLPLVDIIRKEASPEAAFFCRWRMYVISARPGYRVRAFFVTRETRSDP